MRTLVQSIVSIALTLSFSVLGAEPSKKAPNVLTASEKAAGWKLLFDGRTTDGWRAIGKKEIPAKGWVVADGWLKHEAKGGGGDIVTKDEFRNFELTFEWKVAPGANSGVKYLISDSRGPVGHEYQVIDDATHADAHRGGKWQTGALYDLIAPKEGKKLFPAGEINQGKILVKGKHVEHWLNGEKLLECELESDEMIALIAKSKFKNAPQFGVKAPTLILLQDHGDETWFRNLKIRELAGD